MIVQDTECTYTQSLSMTQDITKSYMPTENIFFKFLVKWS